MNEINNILDSAESILVTSHLFPDWDAVCSLLATYSYITKSFPDNKCEMFLTKPQDPSFNFLNDSERINWVRDISEVVGNFDTLVFLDGNSLNRFTNEESKIDLSKYKTICIDHHPDAPNVFDVNIVEVPQASAAQLIYKHFFRDNKELLDKETAEVLLTGIMGDTATFRSINYKTSETLILAKELIDASQSDIQSLELNLSQISQKEFELLKVFIANTVNLELPGVMPFTYSFASLDLLKQGYSIKEIKRAGDRYKLSIIRQIKGFDWGFVVTPDSQDTLGISFRSTPGSPNVSVIAKNFNGGGHVFAAGGRMEVGNDNIKDSIDVCNAIIDYIKNNKLEVVDI